MAKDIAAFGIYPDRATLETEAIKSAGTIDSYGKSLFKDACGWTPN